MPPTSRRRNMVPRAAAASRFRQAVRGPTSGPDRSNWIENGVRVNESDTGRVRKFLVHPNNPDIVYVLKSSGGLWKTTNFSHPRPNWRPMSDHMLSTSGGSVAFGKNPRRCTSAPVIRSIPVWAGGFTSPPMAARPGVPGIKLGPSTVIPDVKVDTSGAQDVVFVGTNAGLFRSLNGGATYAAVISGGVHWSLQQTSAGWMVAIGNGAERASSAGACRDRRRGRSISAAGGMAPAGRITLAVGAPGDAVVYAFAATAGSGAQKDLYRSTNGGATFTVGSASTSDAPRRRSKVRQPDGSAEHEHHARPGVLQPHGARRSCRSVAQHRLHRRSAQLGEVDRRRRDLAPRIELARAVRPALRARRSSRGRDRDDQGQADPAVRRRRRPVHERRWRHDVQQRRRTTACRRT